jgi:hypothetical protein
MAATESSETRLERLSTICGALPGVERETHGSHATFKVARKPFVYYLHDHHGDGVIGVACKVPAGENVALVAANPKRFYMPAYVGPRGWVGLRLDKGRVSWREVGELVRTSYGMMAPKRLLRTLE